MESMPIQGGKSVTLEFSVTAEDVSRSTPTSMESAINSLRIYAFYNDKSVGYLYREITTSGVAHYLDLQLPESGKHNVEFYLIANEAEMAAENGVVALSEGMSKADLEKIVFTGIRHGASLPMYDKRVEEIDVDAILAAANSEAGHEGHYLLSQKVEFQLSRPIAKLSLYGAKVSGATANPQIHKVEFLAGGTRQYNYLFPQDAALLDEIPSRANNRSMLESVVNDTDEVIKGDAMAQDPENYTVVVAGEYLSEVAVGASAWNTPSGSDNAGELRIEYSLGEGHAVRNGFVYLPAIQRNHHIKVCVLFSADGDLVVNYDVAEWEDNSMLYYHFDYPTHSYLMESLPTTENIESNPSGAATMRENEPFKGFFQMTKPSNDAWTPTLLGLNGGNCEIIVYDIESGDEVTTFPIPASDKWYRIEVWPLVNKMDIGQETMLAISYKASGLSESEFLLINGSNLNYYWPYSGSTAQDANYVIITMVN
jgi:hypothetical protein